MRWVAMGVAVAASLLAGPGARGEEALEPTEAPEPATVEDAGEGPSAVEAQASEAFEQGRRHFEAERYAEAAASFEQAYDLLPRPTVHYNVARALELAGRRDLARARYQLFLDSGVGSPGRRRLALERIASLSGESARFVVSTHPPGGFVFIDDRAEGQEPVSVAVRPGRHRIEVRLRGVASSRVVDVALGERRRLAFALHSADPLGRGEEPATEMDRSLNPGYFWATIGFSVAVTAATAALFAAALSVHLDSRDTGDLEIAGLGDAQALATSGDVLLGFALALPAVAVILAFHTDWVGSGTSSRGAGSAVAPGPGRRPAGPFVLAW